VRAGSRGAGAPTPGGGGQPEIDWPHAAAVVDLVLVAEYEGARAALDELAARYGWTVPVEVAPESLR
jgi:hypothetical protein